MIAIFIISAIPLFLTLLIELGVLRLLGFKNRKLFIGVALINLITNPTLCFTLTKSYKLIDQWGILYIFFLEVIIVILEYLMLKSMFKKLELPFFKLSFVLNASSFMLGVFVYGFLAGCI